MRSAFVRSTVLTLIVCLLGGLFGTVASKVEASSGPAVERIEAPIGTANEVGADAPCGAGGSLWSCDGQALPYDPTARTFATGKTRLAPEDEHDWVPRPHDLVTEPPRV